MTLDPMLAWLVCLAVLFIAGTSHHGQNGSNSRFCLLKIEFCPLLSILSAHSKKLTFSKKNT